MNNKSILKSFFPISADINMFFSFLCCSQFCLLITLYVPVLAGNAIDFIIGKRKSRF